MFKKYSGQFLFGAVLFGPAMFGILIIMNLRGGGFSFLSHMMCSLAIESVTTRFIFGVTAWGMAFLHIPFFLNWPDFIISKGVSKPGRIPFLIFGFFFVLGFLLFSFLPMDPGNTGVYRLHQIAAVIFFASSSVISLICAFNVISIPGTRKIYPLVSLLWAVVTLLFLVPFTVFALQAPPYQNYVNLLNWIYLLVYGPWAILHALLVMGKISIMKSTG